MFASASEPAQESFACNGIPGVEDAEVAEIKNLKNNNQSENRSPSFGGGGGSPLQEIDEHYVCDIAMMRIGGEEGLPVTHKAPVEDDDSPSPMAHNGSTNNENEVEIDRQEEEQAVSDLVRSSSAGALMEA